MRRARAMLLGLASLILLCMSACGGSKKATGDIDTEDSIPTDPSEADAINEDMGPIDALDPTEASDLLHDVEVDLGDAPSDTIDIEEDGPCSTTVWHTYSATDTPIAIPDNDETGVESTITVDDCDIEVNDIRVDVNITHPFIGDLKLKLISPSGEEIYLHDRTGNVTDDIITTYPTSTIPAQTTCVLIPISSSLGDWKLNVSDNGAADVGTFNSWSISLRGTPIYCPANGYFSMDTFPIVIPDWDSTGITSSIIVSDSSIITDINVLIDIQHEWIGDIRVTLESPSGSTFGLYDNPGTPGTYLTSLFPLEMAPIDSFVPLIGIPRNGTWLLHVYDLNPTLYGSLLQWSLFFD